MNNYYCWSNAKFFGGTIWPHVSCKCHVCHTPEVHVSFCIRWYWPQKCVVVSLPGIFWHSNFILCVAVKFRHGENLFLQIFIGFSWLCGTSFDVMMTVCWMLWRFYLLWSSLLCLWLCWQISVSFCIPLRRCTRRRSFKKRHAGLVNSSYQPLHCIK